MSLRVIDKDIDKTTTCSVTAETPPVLGSLEVVSS